MDHMALIGVHRLKRDVAAVLDDLARDLLRQPLQRFLALAAVVLGVDVDAHALVLAAVDGVVGQMLDGVERLAAAADQDAQIFADEVDHIALIRVFHGVRHGVRAHVLKQALHKDLDRLLDRAGLRGCVGLWLGGRSGLFFNRLFLCGLRLLRPAVFTALRTRLVGLRCARRIRFRLLRLGLRRGRRRNHTRSGLSRRGDDPGGDPSGRRGLLWLAARCAGEGGRRRSGLLVGHLVGHLDLGRLRADAKKARFGIFQNFNRDAVAVHAELLKRGGDGQIDGLSGCGNKLFHVKPYSSLSSAEAPLR